MIWAFEGPGEMLFNHLLQKEDLLGVFLEFSTEVFPGENQIALLQLRIVVHDDFPQFTILENQLRHEAFHLVQFDFQVRDLLVLLLEQFGLFLALQHFEKGFVFVLLLQKPLHQLSDHLLVASVVL